MNNGRSAWDPVALRVTWDRLISICENAAATMVRTTFSPIVREGNDYCCSLLDAQGRQLAEPPHTLPSFTGTLPFTVRHFLRRYPAEQLVPGDSLITNDSWLGTGHLNDFNVATPVFDSRGKVIAFASCTAHMTDIGGSINFGANREILEEGLRVPICKVARAGQLNDDLIELIRYNVRLPDECIGDLLGMLAANRTMGDRLHELIDDQSISDFDLLAKAVLERSEMAMRAAIEELPEGQATGAATFDGVGKPVEVRATVRVAGGVVEVDYAGSSPADTESSLNVATNYTYAYTVYPLKLLVHPRLPSNDGCLRFFRVSAPEGSILNSRWPAAGFARHHVGHMLHAALFSAFAQLIPDRVWGHSGSASSGLESLSGTNSGGQPFVHTFFIGGGGTGAMPAKDGECCYFPSNMRATSVETSEALVPVLFERKELICDSAGPGRHRGGLGVRWTVRNIDSKPMRYSAMTARINHPAEGLLGGLPGRRNRLFIKDEEVDRGWGRWELEPGQTVTKESAGGGGLGSPLSREVGLVIADVRDGLVSEAQAEATYGLKIRDGALVAESPARTEVGATGAAGRA